MHSQHSMHSKHAAPSAPVVVVVARADGSSRSYYYYMCMHM